MPARSYQPSGQSNSGGLSLLVVACLGAAVAAGIVEGFVSKWFSLLILFPAVLGGAVAFAATKVIAGSHVRAPLVAALVAGLAGMVGQGAVAAVQYVQFRSDLGTEFAENPKLAGQGDPAALVDQFLEQETSQRGFVGYLKFRAQIGTEIKNAGHTGSGLKLSGIGFWILLGVNCLIASGIAATSAYSRASIPYCETCKNWYEKTERVGSGSGEKAAVAGALRALDSGIFTDVPAALGTPTPTSASVFHLLRCDNCGDHEPQLHLTVVNGVGKKQKTSQPYKAMLRSDEARNLLSAFAAAAPPESKSS